MAWEWWNEEDWTPITPQVLIPWIQEMTPVLRQYDPYHHLITTSFAQSSVPEVANLPEIDFAQLHLYDATDPAFAFPDLYETWRAQIPKKPILFGEFGNSAGLEDARSTDQQGLHLHNSLWASTFAGYASTAMYWWWDSYVDPLGSGRSTAGSTDSFPARIWPSITPPRRSSRRAACLTAFWPLPTGSSSGFTTANTMQPPCRTSSVRICSPGRHPSQAGLTCPNRSQACPSPSWDCLTESILLTGIRQTAGNG